ncbi:hypothetical protein G6F42_012070 [Rhizopus arrhizus]|nr:hypothetical protein G6F42_012070 [Rhizopus arrhizus]
MFVSQLIEFCWNVKYLLEKAVEDIIEVKKDHQINSAKYRYNPQECTQLSAIVNLIILKLTKEDDSEDKASFHINSKRNFSWSRKGARARVKIPKTRAPTHTILGATCAHGVVNICIKRPRVVPEQEANATKKRKSAGGGTSKIQPISGKGSGTSTGHYFNFVKRVLDQLDKHEQFKDYYLVMDNVPIHKNNDIRKLIEGRGYDCVYLPSYSPEVNPIEQFWSVCKNPDNIFEKRKKMGRPRILQEEHKSVILECIDDNPSVVLDEVMKKLKQIFTELKVSKSTLFDFVKKHCKLSLKKARFHPIDRNSEEKIQERLDWVHHYPHMKGYYLVMDNAPIHTSEDIAKYVESRGYHCVYLPPYSPGLNPIEQFWSVVKSKVKRSKFLEKETLMTRIGEASNSLRLSDFKMIVRHSHKCLDKCRNRQAL